MTVVDLFARGFTAVVLVLVLVLGPCFSGSQDPKS